MGGFSLWHWMVVLLVVMLLFGGGKISGLMGEFARGVKTFRKTMAEDEGHTNDAVAGTGQDTLAGPLGTHAEATAAVSPERA